jgi:hypothetical protein
MTLLLLPVPTVRRHNILLIIQIFALKIEVVSLVEPVNEECGDGKEDE